MRRKFGYIEKRTLCRGGVSSAYNEHAAAKCLATAVINVVSKRIVPSYVHLLLAHARKMARFPSFLLIGAVGTACPKNMYKIKGEMGQACSA